MSQVAQIYIDNAPATALGRVLRRDFSEGVSVAIFDSDEGEFQRKSSEWAQRERALGFDRSNMRSAALALGRAVDDRRGVVRAVRALGGKLQQEIDQTRSPDDLMPFPGTGPSKIKVLALFSHGWGTTLAIGNYLTKRNVRSVIQRLAPFLTDDVTIALYGCSIAANPSESGWVSGTMDSGGAQSLAAMVRDALVDEGKTSASVWGHTEVGHTTRNPSLRVFHASPSHPLGGGKGADGFAYAGDFIFGQEVQQALSDVESAVQRAGNRVAADKRNRFTTFVQGRLRSHFYKAWVGAVITRRRRNDGTTARQTNLTLRGASLPQMAPMYPDEVATIVRNHWRNTYWTQARQDVVARKAIRRLRALGVFEASDSGGAEQYEQQTSRLIGARGKTWSKVRNTTRAPYRWICAIYRDAETVGTGILFGPSRVLTAAHVVENIPSNEAIYVAPAAHFYGEPFGRVRVRRPVRASRFRRHGDAFDYAVLHLEKDVSRRSHGPVRALSFWGGTRISTISPVDPTRLQHQRAFTSGYPGRKRGNQFESHGQAISGPQNRNLVHTLATSRGHSGSPIWINQGGVFNLVGLATRATSGKYNHGLRVTDEFIREINRL